MPKSHRAVRLSDTAGVFWLDMCFNLQPILQSNILDFQAIHALVRVQL